jgi:hypothetical protein
MASVNKVIGGKKLNLALKSIEDKIVNAGVLRVGFLEKSTYPATKKGPSLHVAQVAFWNEFGTTRIPARPFFRTTIQRQSTDWGDKLGKAVKATNYDGQKALALLGQSMRDDVENAIAQWSAPGNAPSTIKAKGFDKALVDTGTMQRAVDYEVKPK